MPAFRNRLYTLAEQGEYPNMDFDFFYQVNFIDKVFDASKNELVEGDEINKYYKDLVIDY